MGKCAVFVMFGVALVTVSYSLSLTVVFDMCISDLQLLVCQVFLPPLVFRPSVISFGYFSSNRTINKGFSNRP